jgi:hypothetical protein
MLTYDEDAKAVTVQKPERRIKLLQFPPELRNAKVTFMNISVA